MKSPSTEWSERIPEGEAARLEALAEELLAIQRKNAKGGAAGRGLHFKPHVGVRATLEVKGDLPEHARHGLFATPKTYEALVRFSNGTGRYQKDRTGDVRGLAVKVLGVSGKKIIPGLEDTRTQDFLFIHTARSPFRNAEEFVGLVVAAAGGELLLLPRLAGRLGIGRAFGLVRATVSALNRPFHTFAGVPMFTLLPLRYGPYAARLKLEPVGELTAPSLTAGPDALADDLRARLKEVPLAWDLAAQFFVDEERTPIEDPTVDWSEADSPYTTVARLTIAKQDLSSDEGKRDAELIETLSFDPWHALVEHRPLGQLMRARNHAYRLSTIERKAAPEPE